LNVNYIIYNTKRLDKSGIAYTLYVYKCSFENSLVKITYQVSCKKKTFLQYKLKVQQEAIKNKIFY